MNQYMIAAIAVVFFLCGFAVTKWQYDTCRGEGLSKTYCMQRVLLR